MGKTKDIIFFYSLISTNKLWDSKTIMETLMQCWMGIMKSLFHVSCKPYIISYHIKLYYRFSQSFSNFFHSFSFKEQFNFVPENVLEQKSISIFKLLSSNFNIVSLYFVIMSLIFVIVAILFVLPYRRVVNHKSNFVLCHSFSHICHPNFVSVA